MRWTIIAKHRRRVEFGALVTIAENVAEFLDGIAFFSLQIVEDAGLLGLGERSRKFLDGRDDFVLGCHYRGANKGWVPIDRGDDAISAGLDHEDFDTAIGVHSRTDIPSVTGVR